MADMSISLIHHGHVRILKKAAEYGEVVVGLPSDEDIKKYKNKLPVLKWEFRKEILEAILYVSEVVLIPFAVTDEILDNHNAKFLIHGDDDVNVNLVSKDRLIVVPRTTNISSSMMCQKANREEFK